MATTERGSSVSIHEGGTNRTCILVASGTDPSTLAEDIRTRVAKEVGFRYSDIPPKVTAIWQDDRVIVSGEGGNVEHVAQALAAELANMPTEPPPLVLE